MLALLHATANVAVLGFTSAILYYVHFSQRAKLNGFTGIILDARFARALAILGLVLWVLLAPAIALGGIETILAFCRRLGWPDGMVHLVAGFWINLSLIAGWLFEYSLLRESRNLPAMRFSL